MRVSIPAQAAARPVVTSRGVYYPRRYSAWLDTCATLLKQAWAQPPAEGPVAVSIVVWPDSFDFDLTAGGGRFGRADLDNLLKGLLDAAVRAGVMSDDSQVTGISIRFGGL